MREWLINRLEMPPRTVLNRKIPKKSFFTQANFSPAEKDLFTAQVEGIYLLSVMNQQSTNIAIYQDDEFHYAEVVWVYVELRMSKDLNKIIGAVHKSIPNPVVLVMASSDGQILLSTSHKRLNKNDKTKIVADQPTVTEWFNPVENDTEYFKLLNLLAVSNLSYENLHSTYEDIHQWIKCGELIQLVGTLPADKDKREETINILSTVHKQRKKVEQLKLEQKGQLDFGAKMDLHMNIKRYEQQINTELKKIRELC